MKYNIEGEQIMKRTITLLCTGIVIGCIMGVFLVYPGIFAWTHHLPFAEVWVNMFRFNP